jgi:beta-phosphoglucomutase-like phosphatase (HAD superfamily)
LTLRRKRNPSPGHANSSRGFFPFGDSRRGAPGGDRVSAVLLDLDGCLLDSNDAHARAWSRALARFGHRVSAARIRREIGKGGKELLRDFVGPAERHFLGDALGRTQTRFYLERFAAEVRPIPGAAAAVRAMRRAGIAVVVASSADRSVVARSLSTLRLDGVVTGFTSADDVEKAKPFDDVFSLAISRFRLANKRPVAVGDTPYDVAAAHQIGVPCLALESGGFPRKTLACAEALFASLADLWERGRTLFA